MFVTKWNYTAFVQTKLYFLIRELNRFYLVTLKLRVNNFLSQFGLLNFDTKFSLRHIRRQFNIESFLVYFTKLGLWPIVTDSSLLLCFANSQMARDSIEPATMFNSCRCHKHIVGLLGMHVANCHVYRIILGLHFPKRNQHSRPKFTL